MPWVKMAATSTGNGMSFAPATFLAAFNTLFTNMGADPTMGWEVASYQTTQPAYLLCRRKNGAPGRLMFFGGTAPAAGIVMNGVSVQNNRCYIIYHPTSTLNTPSQSYASGSPLGGTAGLHYIKAVESTVNDASFRTYWHEDADILCIIGTNGNSVLSFLVGKWLRSDNGTVTDAFSIFASDAPWRLSDPTGQTTYTGNYSGTICFAYEPTNPFMARLCDPLRAGSNYQLYGPTYLDQQAKFVKADGTTKFIPYIFYPMDLSAPVEGSSRIYTSRYVGWGPPKSLEWEWKNNALVSQGLYPGFTTTAQADNSCFTLLHNTF